MNRVAMERGEWAGAPLPVSTHPLVLEKRYPYQKLQGATSEKIIAEATPEPPANFTVRNHWYCAVRSMWVYVFQEADGRITKGLIFEGAGKRLDYWVNTASAATAYTVEAEERALSKLREMITPHLYRMYFCTGVLLETSKRTGIVYVFRRNRPTIALRGDGGPSRDRMRILAVLCMHPIGYYQETWAGVMTPTDDVIAHLTLMRGDEAMFWRKSNHHPSYSVTAGI